VDLFHTVSHADGFTLGQDFGTFQDSGFGSVTDAVSFQDWNTFLASLEDGSVTKNGNSAKVFPSRRAQVSGLTSLILSSINVNNLVIKPHVRDGHPVLGQSTGFIGTDSTGTSQSFNGL
jgi:hypothetical protein